MTFLLLTFTIMALSILLIYKITNFFGCKVKFRALVLCGIMAFLVNFVTVTLSAFLTRAHFIRIIGFVIVTAAIVTYYNEYLLRHDRKASDIALEEVPPTADSPEPVAVEKPTSAPAVPVEEPAASMPATPAGRTAHRLPFSLLAQTSLQDFLLQTLRWEIQHRRQPLAELRRQPKKVMSAHIFHAPAILQKTIREIVQEDMENDKLLKLTAAIAKLGSLDDILDYAFEQANRHNYSNAIFAYKRALERYANDDYAPFIVIELGNLYRENGAYEEALHTYAGAFSLPSVAKNDAIHEEFQKNILYLRIVKYILSKHNALKTPYNSIPPTYRQEIEAIFQNRRTQKIVS